MKNQNNEDEYRTSNVGSVLAGLLIGSLAGAATMMLFAPQSGEKTRQLIQEKGIELRDQTAEMLEDAMAQVRSDGKKLTNSGSQKAKQLMHDGQSMVVEQLDNVSEAALAGKKAILNA